MTRGARPAGSTASARGKRAEITSALDALRRIVRALQRSHRIAEQRWDVSAAQLLVLQQLADGAPLSINELAERTFTHQSTVSVVVTRLVRRRLVTRVRSSDDARRTEITLTASGRQLLSRAMVVAQNHLIAALGRMKSQDLQKLATCLGVLSDELGMAEEPAGMFFEHDGRSLSGSAASASRRGAAASSRHRPSRRRV